MLGPKNVFHFRHIISFHCTYPNPNCLSGAYSETAVLSNTIDLKKQNQ